MCHSPGRVGGGDAAILQAGREGLGRLRRQLVRIPDTSARVGLIDEVTSAQSASVSSDRRAQKDSQFEVTGAGNVAPEDVRQLGSNPVVPNFFRKKPFG